MIKKILKIAGVFLLLIIMAAVIMIVTLIHNPGFYIRLMSDKLTEDKAVEISYNYDLENSSRSKPIPAFYFRPSESGKYTFSAVDIESNSNVYITMSVMDRYLDDYIIADNRKYNREGKNDTISGSTTLQASQPCYVLLTADPREEDLAQYSGSFKLIVTRESGEEGPPQLTMDGPVTINVESEGQASALFVPPETGYYRFEHSIVSRDSSKGYSSISSITSSDKIKVGVTSDICMLQKGKEYYIWLTANETYSRRSTIELSCMPMVTEKANGICSLDISGDSVIEYFSGKNCNLAVYTVSKGDPRLVIYEQAGFPLRTDDKSEASLSDNPDDVATVLKVKEGTGLHICIFGDVADCRVYLTEYTGEGTSLTIDDLAPVKQKPDKAEQEPEQQKQEP